MKKIKGLINFSNKARGFGFGVPKQYWRVNCVQDPESNFVIFFFFFFEKDNFVKLYGRTTTLVVVVIIIIVFL